MSARLILLSITLALTLILTTSVLLPALASAAEPQMTAKYSSIDKGLKYDHKMVAKAPDKQQRKKEVMPYTVWSWRPLL